MDSLYRLRRRSRVTGGGPHDLHLLGEDVENVFLEERVANLFKRLEVELGAEVAEH
jgi:hypothetical protein